MSMISTVSDVNNTFLSRRELVCDFAGLGGRLKKLDAVDMVSKEFKLDGKIVIPVKMASHVGKPLMTGTFYVYEDEGLAKKQVDPAILSRLDRAKKKAEEAEAATKAEEAEAATKAEEAEAATKAEEAEAATKAEAGAGETAAETGAKDEGVAPAKVDGDGS